jgi:ABC-type transport system involved in multi-copper enzyme maturation permease subunit
MLKFSQIEFQLLPLILTSGFLFLELSLITAAALLFGVFTSSILATLLTFSLYIVGHLSEGMVKLAGVTKNPSFQKMTDNLYLVLPDLSRLDLKNDAVYGVVPTADVLWINAGYAIVYTVALLVVTTVVFSRREF